ncbi:hypothetical protein C8Q74DRAFT_1367751 [Fomes fomentarius]|nr:hypothetical protein C8Q74DRAFT_1367751 [Fomes fomentarius]
MPTAATPTNPSSSDPSARTSQRPCQADKQPPSTHSRQCSREHKDKRSTGDERPRGARPIFPKSLLSVEVFETRFENPFKPRSLRWTHTGPQQMSTFKGRTVTSRPEQQSPLKKNVSLRLMPPALKLNFASRTLLGRVPCAAGDSSAAPNSSVSSTITHDSTIPSGTSTGSTSPVSGVSFLAKSICIRNGVPRTDPYGAPYFARLPDGSSEARGHLHED